MPCGELIVLLKTGMPRDRRVLSVVTRSDHARKKAPIPFVVYMLETTSALHSTDVLEQGEGECRSLRCMFSVHVWFSQINLPTKEPVLTNRVI
jgi:hypothetical protein